MRRWELQPRPVPAIFLACVTDSLAARVRGRDGRAKVGAAPSQFFVAQLDSKSGALGPGPNCTHARALYASVSLGEQNAQVVLARFGNNHAPFGTDRVSLPHRVLHTYSGLS